MYPENMLSQSEETTLDLALNELARLVDSVVAPGKSIFRSGPVCASRYTEPTIPFPALYKPMLCVVAQGTKEVSLGQERMVYHRGRFLLNTITVPATGRILGATKEFPCLSVTIELDPSLVEEVVVVTGVSPPGSTRSMKSMDLEKIDLSLLDAVTRLLRLQGAPSSEYLGSLTLKEILYRLLTGTVATQMFQLTAHGVQMQPVVRVTEWIRNNFTKPLSIATLAKDVGLSPSSLHHQFKLVTGTSPLQFQKQLKLQEARQLMIGQGLDVAHAGYKVGYEDPAYFSRDYRHFFGSAPKKHVQLVRDGVFSDRGMEP